MKSLLGSLFALAVLASSSLAVAHEPAAHAPESEAGPPSFQTYVGLGVTVDETRHKAAVMDGAAFARFGVLGVGGTLQLGTRVLSDHYVYAGPSVGVFAPTPRWLELGIAGTIGVRAYSGVGAGLGDDPGASAVVASGGARAIAAVSLPVYKADRQVRASLGVTALAEDDLQRKTVSYTYNENHPWLGARSGRFRDSAEVGTARYAGLIVLGASY